MRAVCGQRLLPEAPVVSRAAVGKKPSMDCQPRVSFLTPPSWDGVLGSYILGVHGDPVRRLEAKRWVGDIASLAGQCAKAMAGGCEDEHPVLGCR